MNNEQEFISELITMTKLEGINYLTTFLSGEDAVLRCIFFNKGISPQELAHMLNVTKGRISVLLRNLTKKNYIEMSINKEDHRKVDLELTSVGLNYFKSIGEKAEKYFDILFERLGKEQTEQLIAMLKKINQVMKGVTL